MSSHPNTTRMFVAEKEGQVKALDKVPSAQKRGALHGTE